MTFIEVDFNARTEDDRVRLDTSGSKRSLLETSARVGDWVWLSDGEVRVGGLIEESHGRLVAKVAWETTEHIPTPEERGDSARVQAAVDELQVLMQQRDREHGRVLEVLPLAETRLRPGRAEYIRSRVAQSFNRPHLALLAIDEALAKSPGEPGFIHQRLDLLKSLDLDRAFEEAKRFAEDANAAAVVLAACASVYSARAKHSSEEELVRLEHELLQFTDRFENVPDRAVVGPAVAVMVYLTRGFAFLHLGDRDQGLAEISRAIELDPSRAEAHAARGLETYPSDESVRDLEVAVKLGLTSFWPAYYLAHLHLQRGEWEKAWDYIQAALLLDPSPEARANLLEWRAIARVEGRGEVEQGVRDLDDAAKLAPGNARVKRNLEMLRQLGRQGTEKWALHSDVERPRIDMGMAA